MTDLEKTEFVRISEENADFKQIIRGMVKTYHYGTNLLGIDFTAIKSFDDVMTMLPEVIFKFQSGEIEMDVVLAELNELKEVLPMVEKYKHLLTE